MATNLPQPQSYEQIVSAMESAYAAKMGISDYNTGSLVTSFFEVVALMVARSSGDIFQILTDFSLDRATGDILDRLATENNLTRLSATVSSGLVTITDTSFSVISTQIYAGINAPNIGTVSLPVADASSFPASGSVYIGRGTNNVEGPIVYDSITANGSYYLINLATPTTKFHNINESVILAQGGTRSIPLNTVVYSPGIGSSPDIQFNVTAAAVILDGDVTVSNVPVSAVTPGSTGNVPRQTITQFTAVPFSGATVSNPLSFTNGQDTETDNELRVRIKAAQSSTGLGTETAIQSAIYLAKSSDGTDSSSITSSSIILSSNYATVYIDDGTGYEEKSAGVGLESIVDYAIGGEKFFQLATGGSQAPVAKAFLQSTLGTPFDLEGGDTLAVIVGETTYQHTFATTDFASPGGATAYEIAASINADTTLGFEATTAGSGVYVVIRAIAETEDNIQVTVPTVTSGRDAAVQMGFSSNQIQTLRLYKNDIPLNKDGLYAIVTAADQSAWSSTIVTGDTLILSVDGTAAITYTIQDSDFVATGLYTSVSYSNSLASWVEVFNNKLTGVTAAISGEQITLTSNLGTSSRAQVVVGSSSTLVSKGMFNSTIGLSSQGAASDYTLSRNTAQFELTNALVAGDKLAAGSTNTEARIESSLISGGSTVLSSEGHIWILNDAPGTIINTGLVANSTISITKPATNTICYTSNISSAFSNVLPGDYVIIWSPQIPTTAQLEGRVNAVTATTLEIVVTSAEYTAVTPISGVVYSSGFAVVRTNYVPQKFTIAAGTYSLDALVLLLQAQTDSMTFSAIDEEYLVVKSNSMSTSGSILIVTADNAGSALGFSSGASASSYPSLIAFSDSQYAEAQMPLFIHSTFSSEGYADPDNSYISTINTSVDLSSRDPNELIAFLHPYGQILDAQPVGESTQETTSTTNTVGLADEDNLRRIRINDRFYVASPLGFGYNDSSVVIVDQNSGSSFTIPFYRPALTNTTQATSTTSFNAYDVNSGATAQFQAAFGTTFDFSNYKVLMQAKKVLKPTAPKTAILYRAVPWGRSGNAINVGYIYPGAANTALSSIVTVDSSVNISIVLSSGTSIATSIDNTTEWNVTITPNAPSAGIDQVTYTYSGVGTAPNLSLTSGQYVNISTATEFNVANTGSFMLSQASGFAPTATSFTVQAPHGQAVAQTNAATQVNGAIQFYNAGTSTAAQIAAYVNANLASYVYATLVMDTDTSGSGVIAVSTYEDSGFSYESVYLLDGINWIASSNLTGSPQFTLKKPLSLPTDVGYAFNNGETVQLIPTTMEQVEKFISITAVTGFSTMGTINLVDRGSELELATDTVGSSGAIQVIGGTANSYSVPVLDTAESIDNTYMSISANRVAASGVSSDQWFRLQAANVQSKLALFNSNTSINVASNTPTTGQATLTFLNRTLEQRYFGKPRHSPRIIGRTFRIEKQGTLTCLSWTGVGGNPFFVNSSLNFNTSGGGTLNVYPSSTSGYMTYQILTGQGNFNDLIIGDFVAVAGLNSDNNGTFLVVGVSDDGTLMEVENADGIAQYSFGTVTLLTNSSSGDTFTVGTMSLVAGTNFVIGATVTETATNLSAVIGTLTGVTSTVSNNVVTVTANAPAANIAIAYSGTGSVTVSGASLQGITYSSSTFSASSGVSEGDSMIISGGFSSLNQGTYRVIRQYNNSVWYENSSSVNEEITLPVNSVSLGFDSTTLFQVNATEHTQLLTWTGTGTEPTLGNAIPGDIVTFGTDFSAGNQKILMVIDSGVKQQQITQITLPAGPQFTLSAVGQYFLITSGGDVNKYAIWYNVSGTNTAPTAAGYTLIEVDITNAYTAAQVALATQIAINASAVGMTATVSGSNVTVTTTAYQSATEASNVTMPTPFAISILQAGQRTYLECTNPSAVNQSSVTITGTLTADRPQILFYEYEATIPGDKIVVSGNVLGTTNNGTFVVSDVLNRNVVIVTGSLASIFDANLDGYETSVSVQEGVPYSGYKHVSLISAQPGTTNLSEIIFDTDAQYEKVNQSGDVELTSLNKLNFATTIKLGLDSYRYNTGLIREANRIIYGDQTDSVSYAGCGAAGAEIFVRGPLVKRVTVSLVVRLATGISFSQVSDQIRNSVQSLIDSNPIGQSIAISAIVSAVNAIYGVKAVSISSPTYNSNGDDLITLQPSEKAIIVDPSSDIGVSVYGS